MRWILGLLFLCSALVASAQLELRSATYPPLLKSIPPASPVTPPVAGFLVWLDANDPATLFLNSNCTVLATAGTPNCFVAGWKDKSVPGTNNVFMDTPGANERRPALSNNWIGGKPALIFGSPAITAEERSWLQSLTNNIILGQTGITVFVVAMHNQSGTGNSFDRLFVEGAFWELRRQNTTTNMEIAGTGALTNYTDNVAATWCAILYNGSTTNIQLWRNGNGPTAQNVVVSTFPTRTGFAIGKNWVSGPTADGLYWHGSVGEVIVYPWKLNVSDFGLVNSYLTNKWGTHD